MGRGIDFLDRIKDVCSGILGRGNDRVQLALNNIDTCAAVVFWGGIKGGDFPFGFLNGIGQGANFGFQHPQFGARIVFIVVFMLHGELFLLFHDATDVGKQLSL